MTVWAPDMIQEHSGIFRKIDSSTIFSFRRFGDSTWMISLVEMQNCKINISDMQTVFFSVVPCSSPIHPYSMPSCVVPLSGDRTFSALRWALAKHAWMPFAAFYLGRIKAAYFSSIGGMKWTWFWTFRTPKWLMVQRGWPFNEATIVSNGILRTHNWPTDTPSST